MSRYIKGLLAFGAVCAVAVLCLALPVTAAPADKTGAPEASEPKDDSAGDAAKPDEKGATPTTPCAGRRPTRRPRTRLRPALARSSPG